MPWTDVADRVYNLFVQYIAGFDTENTAIGDENRIFEVMSVGGRNLGCVIAYDTLDSTGSRFAGRGMRYTVMATIFSPIVPQDEQDAYRRVIGAVDDVVDSIVPSALFVGVYQLTRIGAGPVLRYVRGDRAFYVVPFEFVVETR